VEKKHKEKVILDEFIMIKTVEQDNWLYWYEVERGEKYDTENGYEKTKIRYLLGEILGESKTKVLICIGINPSTATPKNLDPTLIRVRQYAKANGYGVWYMLNLYPWRETNSIELKRLQKDNFLSNENEKWIRKIFDNNKDADVWCAWGNSLRYQENFKKARDIVLDLISAKHSILLFRGDLTKKGNPRHPLDRTKGHPSVVAVTNKEKKDELIKKMRMGK
jgi:hypothetical protein